MRITTSLLLVILLAFTACKENYQTGGNKKPVVVLSGETMGTYYNVRFVGDKSQCNKAELDSLLIDLNQAVSTYIPSSRISVINNAHQESFVLNESKDSHFITNLFLTKEMYDLSLHYFDPTLNPLVNFWGFGHEKIDTTNIDLSKIPELLKKVSFGKWSIQQSRNGETKVIKPAKASIDFSAIAKGYGVDLVCQFLSNKGLKDFFVDIGGEVKAQGKKPNKKNWVVGINTPTEMSKINDAILFVNLNNMSVATSGNYRRFYEKDGQKFSHIINPFSGMCERSKLLSATVFHQQCSKADAMATALIVMGLEKAKALINSLTDFEAILIFVNEKGELEEWFSKDAKQKFVH